MDLPMYSFCGFYIWSVLSILSDISFIGYAMAGKSNIISNHSAIFDCFFAQCLHTKMEFARGILCNHHIHGRLLPDSNGVRHVAHYLYGHAGTYIHIQAKVYGSTLLYMRLCNAGIADDALFGYEVSPWKAYNSFIK